jgi:Spy/CpxP family protein refolding chaperone
MDLFTKNRFALISIITLVVLNIFTLTLLWIFHFRQPERVPPPFDRRAARVEKFLERRLNLSPEQSTEFKQLRRQHFQESMVVMNEIRELKEKMLDEVFSKDPDSLVVKNLTEQIGNKEAEREWLLFTHFRELRDVCTPEQRVKLEQIFQKIFEGMQQGVPPEMPGRPGRRPKFDRERHFPGEDFHRPQKERKSNRPSQDRDTLN